ncbi:succinate CoA transferase [Akkermansia glycaniphila]|uniref:Ygfh subfam: succinate coa transferase n=1 Tax=Akkermansia glycaniphila TaxID=1679444 RepID=A0A1H6KVT0_9BACT|nr:succinate CoA transferase [Akkermansia glycaniphila]SEH77039.1 ygfh subfam: succinate coa transferase [Akkermansia glycaniphila]
MKYQTLTPDEAAALIENGENIGLSGFTAAGVPKATTRAIAKKAEEEHAAGRPFKINLFTGASTSASTDGALAKANAVDQRTPYQSSPDLRKNINGGHTRYNDMHLSHTAQYMRYGALPRVKTAIIEAANITDDGEITLTTAGGNSPTYCKLADRIIIELNSYHPKELREMHDIYMPLDPPHREPLPLIAPDHRIGTHTLKVDPAKIVGIVHTNEPDGIGAFKDGDPVTDKIGENVVVFLEEELKKGKIPASFLPIQSGVGNIANAVLAALGRSQEIPPFKMYTEVIQDSVIDLMKQGRCIMVGGCSLTVSDGMLADMYKDLDFFKSRVILRPQELSNNPEIVRRLGLICINTAIEVDLFGQVNSTHFFGKQMMNGIGGSGDFARNGYLTIFTCPSIAKGGAISSIVPMVSHHDHTEHDVDIVVTEQGVADLRGKCPRDRAKEIIENCVHPDYRQLLLDYMALTPQGHTPHNLGKAFEMHNAFLGTGDMRNANFAPAE